MGKPVQQEDKNLGLGELIAIALGGMVGGGIFSILGVSVERIGNTTPVAILIGGILALCAAYSYVQLAKIYKDEGATYSFFKKTFPKQHRAAGIVGWLIVFGYISTLALYAFTFSTYFCSLFPVLNNNIGQKAMGGIIILLFATINIVSVKGMGKVEDFIVYTKLIILLFISGLLWSKGDTQMILPVFEKGIQISDILVVSSITFVAYEGFQLVIHAYNEMKNPEKNIPRAIYSSIAIATLLYVVISIAALSVIPKEELIANKEYALAAGAKEFLGAFGHIIVIFGALLATSSAISGTIFGSSRLMAVIAADGFLPMKLSEKKKIYIPVNAILIISGLSFLLLISGGLEVILEFGSITFIIVSLMMAYSNYVKRKETGSAAVIAIAAIAGLFTAGVLILYYEFKNFPEQLAFIFSIYAILGVGALWYTHKQKPKIK